MQPVKLSPRSHIEKHVYSCMSRHSFWCVIYYYIAYGRIHYFCDGGTPKRSDIACGRCTSYGFNVAMLNVNVCRSIHYILHMHEIKGIETYLQYFTSFILHYVIPSCILHFVLLSPFKLNYAYCAHWWTVSLCLRWGGRGGSQLWRRVNGDAPHWVHQVWITADIHGAIHAI